MEPSRAAGDDHTPDTAIRFRAGKKRKAYRQRAGSDAAEQSSTIEPTAANGDVNPTSHPTDHQSTAGDEKKKTQAHGDDDEEEDESESAVAAALRLRNTQRGRRRGAGFGSAPRPGDGSGEQSLVVRDPGAASLEKEGAATNDVSRRFTHQTGMLRDLDDRHMMEFIESRLSSRNQSSASSMPPQASSSAAAPSSSASSAPAAPAPKLRPGQAATQGHLMEVELGDEVRRSNIARTERATGLASADTAADDDRRAKKPRLRRDGKPWRPRNRRGSDAVKRDQLVDEILHESRLDVYERPEEPESGPSNSAQDQEAADDKLLRQFQMQFLEDVANRAFQKKQQQQQQLQQKQPARAANEEVLKGPKLGGSRNDRAAMRDLLLKKEREAKK